MNFFIFLQGLGSISFFASRAFLPAFVTALLLRYGSDVSWLNRTGLLSQIKDIPTWFTSDISLITLGILSFVEFVSQRSSDVRDLLDRLQTYLKPTMAALTYFGILSVGEQEAVVGLIKQAGMFETLPVLAVAGGTFIATQIRGIIFRPLIEADEDDHLGLQRLIRWIGDLWGMTGPLILIVFPLITVGLLGIAFVLIMVIERRIQTSGDRFKVECGNCRALIHPCAMACVACLEDVEIPRSIGMLGRPNANPADIDSLPYRLVAVKRCPICATRFQRRAVKQVCESCEHQLMDDPEFAKSYLRYIDRRVLLVCVVCFGLGLVPILGVIPGVIYYRLAIVAPFQRYIPPGKGFLVRWSVRLAAILLVSFQWLPVAGALALPLMALINYSAYRTAYCRLSLVS